MSNANNLVRRVIEYLPDETLKFNRKDGNPLIFFSNRGAVLTILEENTWDEVRRRIDSVMSNDRCITNIRICSICSNRQNEMVACAKCAKDSCIDCYINIIRTNKGFSKCAFCRYTMGRQVPDHEIEEFVEQIFIRAANYKHGKI